MLRWVFRFLWPDHDHKWKIISTIDVYGDEDGRIKSLPYKTKYILQCEHCGKLKAKEV